MKEEAKKRKEEGQQEERRNPEKRRKLDIRDYLGEKKQGEKMDETEEGGESTIPNNEETVDEEKGEGGPSTNPCSEEKEKEEDESDLPTTTKDGVRWGEWEKGEWMEENFWEKYIEERTRK